MPLLPVARSSLITARRAVKIKYHEAQREAFAMFHLEQHCHVKILSCSRFLSFLNILKCLLDKMGSGMQKQRELVSEMLETNKMGNPPGPARNKGIRKVRNYL